MSRKSKALEFVGEGYNITVTGLHVQITDAMKNYAVEKVAKIEKFTNRIIDVMITMDVQRFEHRVTLVMKLDHILIKSHAITDDMYASIDKAVAKLEAQLLKYKGKLQDHQNKPLEEIDMRVNVYHSAKDQELDETNSAIEEETFKKMNAYTLPHIVKQETTSLKTLTCDEAIMKLELSGDPFLIFRSEEDRKLKVIHRRDDGNLGVVELEL